PPPPELDSPLILVRTAGGFVRRFGQLDAEGIQAGLLDPVTGRIRIAAERIAFRGIYSLAIWRAIAWAQALALMLIALPLTLVVLRELFLSPSPLLYLLAIPMTATTCLALALTFGVRAHYLRVVGARAQLTIRFDGPFYRRRRFHEQLLRRCGLSMSPIP
ncbi:MAG: hypothetical protein HY901_14515, partial [Deltaproteobacteria bacterium]|nr:hypothetical protein [Deltaproteobacteria bacterium]